MGARYCKYRGAAINSLEQRLIHFLQVNTIQGVVDIHFRVISDSGREYMPFCPVGSIKSDSCFILYQARARSTSKVSEERKVLGLKHRISSLSSMEIQNRLLSCRIQIY